MCKWTKDECLYLHRIRNKTQVGARAGLGIEMSGLAKHLELAQCLCCMFVRYFYDLRSIDIHACFL